MSYLDNYIKTQDYSCIDCNKTDVRGNTLYFHICTISTSIKGTKIKFPPFTGLEYDDVLLFNNTNRIIRLRYETAGGIKYTFDILPQHSHLHYTGNYIIKNSVTIRAVNGEVTHGCVDVYFNFDGSIVTTTSTSTTSTTTTSSTSTSTTSSTTTTSTTHSYNTDLTFASDTYAFEEGVSAQAIVTNSVLKLEFDKISNPVGLYNTMTISFAGSPVLQVNYRTEYLGHSFKFTHTNGAVRTGTFGGDINFV